ncbi:hypothetical protein HFV06_08500 [Pseudomonas fluorescens]|nr:hypothetical protein [uncultured Pseudomonas sp.]NKI46363.1 hypothetical protein [Pseudomonas fluorescens]NKI51378.1 hypothetical protein [Pseudomonas fluorescens]NKI63871.1 hypothetical protein [Pseudomonas fluorescens]
MSGNVFRQRYIDQAESLFPVIAMILSDSLEMQVSLTTILEPQLTEAEVWHNHPLRLVQWDWRQILHKFRKKPKRIDVAFYSQEILCGLMTAGISRGRVCVNIRYVEANPDPTHPLKGSFLFVALRQAELFASFSNCKLVSVSQPDPALVRSYKSFGYELVESDRKRELRNIPPKHSLLVKKMTEVAFDRLGQMA